MNKYWIQLISTILFCGTLILCVTMYSNHENKPMTTSNPVQDTAESKVMNLGKAANYLGLTEDALKEIIKQDEKKRASRGPTNAYDFIPYVAFNGNLLFYRDNLDQWVNFHTMNK